MKAEFEEVVGRQYLKAVHLNDSKGILNYLLSSIIIFMEKLFINIVL